MIVSAAGKSLDPAILTSVVFSESSFRAVAHGRRGEVGLAQIHPVHRLGVCRDLWTRIWQPEANLRCAVRLMVAAQAKCGKDPKWWLSRYNGQPCGESQYSRRVLARIVWNRARARKKKNFLALRYRSGVR
jgi:soluble lytic murein transglycosylase-like protein